MYKVLGEESSSGDNEFNERHRRRDWPTSRRHLQARYRLFRRGSALDILRRALARQDAVRPAYRYRLIVEGSAGRIDSRLVVSQLATRKHACSVSEFLESCTLSSVCAHTCFTPTEE